jgi:hypothetical protein
MQNKILLSVFTSLLLCACAKDNVSKNIDNQVVTSDVKADSRAVAVKFLFDASHAETAGNADWVIDEDNSVPKQVPTPAQTGITSSTLESFWTGGISAWGIDLAKLGHTTETLPSTGAITYGVTTNPQDLSKYKVFVVDEPNKQFTSAEKTAILNFVKNGGGLFMVTDHDQSDRDNDGWDSPRIWNDLMANNTIKANPFGFKIDLTNISGTSSNVTTIANTVVAGSQGATSSIEFNNGATMTLNTTQNATVKGYVWQSGYPQTTVKVMVAACTYGTGRVVCLGDSSPSDDGTGAPGNTLYVGYSKFSHSKMFKNACLWLAQLQ